MLRASTQNLAVEAGQEGLRIGLQDTALGLGGASFFDVNLQGQEAFTLAFTGQDGSGNSVKASIIDQTTGALLGKGAASGTGAVARTLRIPLNGIHGMFCLMIEIGATGNRAPAFVLSKMLFS